MTCRVDYILLNGSELVTNFPNFWEQLIETIMYLRKDIDRTQRKENIEAIRKTMVTKDTTSITATTITATTITTTKNIDTTLISLSNLVGTRLGTHISDLFGFKKLNISKSPTPITSKNYINSPSLSAISVSGHISNPPSFNSPNHIYKDITGKNDNNIDMSLDNFFN